MNILIAGVGGQGSLLASRILGSYYLSQGSMVKVSEVHGMSQRGGSVVTYVRAGERVDSPLVPQGEADLLIGLERLEALRWAPHTKPGGLVVVNTRKILPMPVITGSEAYPEGVEESIEAAGRRVVAIDALSLAQQAGDVRAVNVVMLGVVAKLLGGDRAGWEAAIAACVKPGFLELNLQAFLLGYGYECGHGHGDGYSSAPEGQGGGDPVVLE